VDDLVIARRLMPVEAALSRRAVLRGLGSTTAALGLGGCAGLAASGTAVDVSDIEANPTLLAATTRKPVNGATASPWFGTQRAGAMTIARVKLTPPSRNRFSLASIGLDEWRIDGIDRVRRVGDLFDPQAAARNVLIYVHGFNQTFETAVLDAVSLSDGIRFHGDTMVFSWPSKANLFDYGYDRESAMWSRDGLQDVLDGLAASPSVGQINLVAHSIGSMLAMESLRQFYTRHGDAVVDRIGAVVFASPDIDLDVFSSSVQRIGSLAAKVTVIAATNDRALELSGWLAGGITRVGAAQKAQLAQLGLRVIDASDEGWGLINHDLFLSNSAVRQVIRNAVAGRPGA
jgi:esterase/lipase superfamily enzyme